MKLPRFGIFLLLATLTACGASDDGAPTADVDPHGDVDTSGPSPADDVTLADDDGLETADEASQEDTMLVADDSLDVPVEEIDVTGLDEAQAAKRVASPVPGRRVTYAYGVRNRRYQAGFHTGQDYAAPRGTAVVAVRSGRIRWSNDRGGAYGKWMGLDATNGRTYVYCHLSSRRFKAGTRVTAGQRIGRVGATGNVTGPHLHLEDHPKGPFRYAQVRRPKW